MLLGYRKPIDAELLTKMGNLDYVEFSNKVWEKERFPGLGNQVFKINQTRKLPDIILSGIFWICTNRLINLFDDFGVNFESYPTKLLHKDEEILDYQFFHLLQVFPVIDMEKSIVQGHDIENIKLIQVDDTPENSLVRDSYHSNLLFIREDLLQKLVEGKITGWETAELETYRSPRRKPMPWQL